jgi:hypothetical protein
MTLQIFKSVIDGLPYSYADAVEKHRQALLAHRFTGDAAPTAAALVEQAVRRVQRDGEADDFITDYIVVDDTQPVPVPTDAERKQALIAGVRLAERTATDTIIGPGKLRRLGLDVSRVLARPEAARSADDHATLATFASVQARLEAVQYHAATLEAEIDDLAPEHCATWTPAPFPA